MTVQDEATPAPPAAGGRTRTPLSRPKRLFFWGVLVFVALLPFWLVEGYVRLTRPHLDLRVLTGRRMGPNPMGGWADLDAFCAYRGRPGVYKGNLAKTVNSQGFISTPELTVPKPPGTIRIVFLGESSTAGVGARSKQLADADTWPWQTVDRLRKDLPGQRFELINAALGGYTSFESYGRLWSRLRFYSPDVIVVCHGWNEMYYFANPESAQTWKTLPDGSWTFDRTPALVQAKKPVFVDNFIWPSQTLALLRFAVWNDEGDGEAGAPMKITDHYDPRGVDIWRTNLCLLRETSRLIKAELFVAKQATLVVPGLPQEQRARCRYELHGFDHDAHLRAFADVYRVIDEEIPADHIIDLTSVSGRPDCFHDHIHPTKEGASRLAELVAAKLSTHLRDKTAAGPERSGP